MHCVKATPEATANLTATSTTPTYTWLTGWMPAIGMDAATATLKLTNMANAMRVQPCYQLAYTRTDKPSAPALVAQTVYSTDNEYFISATDYALSGVTPGQTYIRFGVAGKVNTSPNTGTCDVALQVFTLSFGMLLPPWTGHVVATDSTQVFIPVSGWLPTLGVLKFEGTVVVSDLTGSWTMKLTYRTATASPESPDAWNTTGLGSAINANGESNTGELTPTTTGKAWIQAGFYCQTSSGVGQADVSVVLGVREAT